jgi:hypothetical protein
VLSVNDMAIEVRLAPALLAYALFRASEFMT